MSNIIIPFNGDIANIPEKWTLCDGNNGTPDLKDKFVKAFSIDGELGSAGGSLTHSHGNTNSGGSSHTHSSNSGGSHKHLRSGSSANDFEGPTVYGGDSGDEYHAYLSYASHGHSSIAGGGSHTHTVHSGSNIPKYYKLIFIMGEEIEFDFPIGSIVMFNGLLTELPRNFVFCDGANGTPDLRDRFIKGVNSFSEIGAKKDSNSHNHEVHNDGAHTHSSTSVSFSHTHKTSYGHGTKDVWIIGKDNYKPSYQGPSHSHTLSSSGGHSHTIPSIAGVEPPYLKLAYIKRIA